MGAQIPPQSWQELKRELMEKWKDLNEQDLESTQGLYRTLLELIERRVGGSMDQVSKKFAEIAARYHLYEEPQDVPPNLSKEKKERILQLKPKKSANRDRKPKDNF